MPGPVPSFASSLLRQSSLFLPHQLYHFIGVQVEVIIIIIIIAVAVVLWGAFGRSRAKGAVLVEVSGAA